MSTDERRAEADDDAGLAAVVAVLLPVLAGPTAAVFLLVGYALEMLDPVPSYAPGLRSVGWTAAALAAVGILFASAGLLVTALSGRSGAEGTGTSAPPAPSRAGDRTLRVASFLAGGRRAHLKEEWAAVLAGDPDNGIVLSGRRRLRYAVGFLRAALRLRLSDAVAPLWLPVDWLLSAESRGHGFIALLVGTQVLYVDHEDGFHALVTEGWGWCAGCGVSLRLLVGWLRRLRGIELAAVRRDSGDG
ncbi:hypothetical protein ABZ915_41850 [Streptomyces sp. NPDC046915]|uniref:hypothetical protein n=1 Tax=Streptomyces sp. NPDC046915 TaxID=3155257 RepID=UPI0033CFE40B